RGGRSPSARRAVMRGTSRLRMAGVTLIELMIVVVVVAILGVIAVPSYRQYTLRAHRTDAKSALLKVQANQERWYLQNNTYSDDPQALGFADGKSENGVYTLTITSADLTAGYTATATPTPGGGRNGVSMTDDAECASFSVTADGLKSAAPNPNRRCW